MNQFIQSVNIDENFWVHNPEIKYMFPFSKLYESDLTKNQVYSSQLMWAIYLYSDPSSKFARMLTLDRQKEIKETYLKNTEFNWSSPEIEELVNAYETKMLSKLQQSLNRLMKKLEERDRFIIETKYNEKNAKIIDTMLANSSEIYKQLKEIENQLLDEGKNGNIKGGRRESMSEKRVL